MPDRYDSYNNDRSYDRDAFASQGRNTRTYSDGSGYSGSNSSRYSDRSANPYSRTNYDRNRSYRSAYADRQAASGQANRQGADSYDDRRTSGYDNRQAGYNGRQAGGYDSRQAANNANRQAASNYGRRPDSGRGGSGIPRLSGSTFFNERPEDRMPDPNKHGFDVPRGQRRFSRPTSRTHIPADRSAAYLQRTPNGRLGYYDDVKQTSGQDLPGDQNEASSRPSVRNRRTVRSTSLSGRAGFEARRPQGYMPAYSPEHSEITMYDRSRYSAAPAVRKPINRFVVIAVIVALVIVGIGAWMIAHPAKFDITLNGNEFTVDRGTTIADLISDGYAKPTAGNLLAVDGSLLQAGAGEAFAATINGDEITDENTTVDVDDVVYIENGADVTEDYTATQNEVTPQITEAGIGALHVYVDGKNGIDEVRTGNISGITVTQTVEPVVNGGLVSYNADTGDDKVVALTFDDGPWPETTNAILDVLDQYGVKATFFTIGEQIADNLSAVQRAAQAGHQIGTHTWDHASGSGQGVNLSYMTPEEQIQEVQKGLAAISEATGSEASLAFRTPGGNFPSEVIWNLAPYITSEIGWNIDTEDWTLPGSDAIARAIMSASPGDVILMHDGGGNRTQTVEALRTALPYLIDQGFRFVTIDELLAYNNAADELAEAQANSSSS